MIIYRMVIRQVFADTSENNKIKNKITYLQQLTKKGFKISTRKTGLQTSTGRTDVQTLTGYNGLLEIIGRTDFQT